MFTVIGFMLTGITVGYLFRNIAFLQKTEKTISITIFFCCSCLESQSVQMN